MGDCAKNAMGNGAFKTQSLTTVLSVTRTYALPPLCVFAMSVILALMVGVVLYVVLPAFRYAVCRYH